MKFDNGLFYMFDSLSLAIVAVDEGKIAYLNPEAVRIFGSDALGNRAGMYFPDELLHGKEVSTGTITIDGHEHSVMSMVENGSGILSISSVAGSEQSAKVTPEMAETVSEVLRSNINVCTSGLELLGRRTEKLEDEKISTYIAMMERSVTIMRRIVDNFAMLSEPVRMLQDKNAEYFDMVKLCSELIETASYLLSSREQNMTFESTCDQLTFLGNSALIERMLLNLISNSVKYTDRGGEISLLLSQTGDDVLLTLKDDGKGMKPDVLSTAFTRYECIRDLSDSRAGAGMGLAVAQNIAAMHGGSIVIESRQGHGTAVSVRLPIRRRSILQVRDNVTNYEDGMTLFMSELAEVLDYTSFLPERKD